ncbi:MAG: hypothetical protein PHH91_12500 [Desulfuromonadaceae bacterium]|nr:hypothetical protein [Desulfuromonadaceae bacterium]
MPLNEKELLERDAKRNIGEELLQVVRDLKSGRASLSLFAPASNSSVFLLTPRYV